jgi:hypothetical protein
MAVGDLSQFDADTTFDRLLLEATVGGDLLLRLFPSSSTDDLRGTGTQFSRHFSDDISGGAAIAALLDRFRPLTLATGWKLLDQIIELAGASAGAAPAPPKRWPIADKVDWSKRAPNPNFEPFVSDRRLWRAVAKLYNKLEEPRNAITHRRYKRGPNREVIPYGRTGRPLRAITADELDAVVFFSYGLAEEVAAGQPNRRRLIAVNWYADQLRALTKHSARSAGAPPQLRRVIVNLVPVGRRWRLDLREIRDHLVVQGTITEIADIEAHLPDDGRYFTGRLEDFPATDAVEFAPSRPPAGLARHG